MAEAIGDRYFDEENSMGPLFKVDHSDFSDPACRLQQTGECAAMITSLSFIHIADGAKPNHSYGASVVCRGTRAATPSEVESLEFIRQQAPEDGLCDLRLHFVRDPFEQES